MTADAYDHVFAAVDRAGCRPREHGEGRATAKCPAHDDRAPSLSIARGEGGRVLVRCFAGCPPEAIVAALGLELRDLFNNAGFERRPDRPRWRAGPIVGLDRHESRPEGAAEDAHRRAVALLVWSQTKAAAGTIVELYLRRRALKLPVPGDIRCHTALLHGPSRTTAPAMLALIRNVDDMAIGVHRTWLAADGSGKAPLNPPRMILGSCHGGAVRLAPAARYLLIGEGVETVLAGMQVSGLPGWAALSAAGIRSLELPAIVSRVTVLEDNDDAGRQASLVAAARWTAEGRDARIAHVPEASPKGFDFNDWLCEQVRT